MWHHWESIVSVGLAWKDTSRDYAICSTKSNEVEQKKQPQAVKKKEEVVAHDDDGEYLNDDEDNDQGENGNMDEDDDGEYSDVEYTEDVETVQQKYSNKFDNATIPTHADTTTTTTKSS